MNRTIKSSNLLAPVLALLFSGLLMLIHERANAQCLMQTVCIDVKPGSDPNAFNCGSKGNLPVAIFGTQYFDVPNEVDVSTVRLRVSFDNFSTYAEVPALTKALVGDLNSDGFPDLLVYFYSKALSSAIGCPLPVGTEVLVYLVAQYRSCEGGPVFGFNCTTGIEVLRINGKK